MPKRIGRRRFDEPRFGISKLMVEAEARELDRELQSYLVSSTNELKEKSENLARSYRQVDRSLNAAVNALPERERFAVMCMLGRELYLVLAVYETYLRGRTPEAHAPAEDARPLPMAFSEWLFSG